MEEKLTKLSKTLQTYLIFFKNWNKVKVEELKDSILITWYGRKDSKDSIQFGTFESKEFPKEDLSIVIDRYKDKIKYSFNKRHNKK